MAYEMIFAALGDSTRREIFESLRLEGKTVGKLAAGRSVSRPAVSQHLKVLQRAGLVNVEAKGTRRIYSVRREGLDELRRYLDSFWSDALSAYAARIQQQTGERHARTRKKDS